MNSGDDDGRFKRKRQKMKNEEKINFKVKCKKMLNEKASEFNENFISNFGKRSELQKSQCRTPKRRSKNLETITTSKSFIIVIRTLKKKKIRTSKSQ